MVSHCTPSVTYSGEFWILDLRLRVITLYGNEEPTSVKEEFGAGERIQQLREHITLTED